MNKNGLTGSKILAKLRGIDELMTNGMSEGDALREFQISKRTYDHWRRDFDGMDPETIDKILSLERENRRLKELVFKDGLNIDGLNENEKFVGVILLLIAILFLLWRILK